MIQHLEYLEPLILLKGRGWEEGPHATLAMLETGTKAWARERLWAWAGLRPVTK